MNERRYIEGMDRYQTVLFPESDVGHYSSFLASSLSSPFDLVIIT